MYFFLYVTGYTLDDVMFAAALDAAKYGKRKNNRIPVFFIGQDNVGKTSLKKKKFFLANFLAINYRVLLASNFPS